MGMEYEAMMERGSLEESCRKRGAFCAYRKGGFLSRSFIENPVTGVCSINSMIPFFILTLSLSILRVEI